MRRGPLRLLGAFALATSLAGLTAAIPFQTTTLYPTRAPGILFLVISTLAVWFVSFAACMHGPVELWRRWCAARPRPHVALAGIVLGPVVAYFGFSLVVVTASVSRKLGKLFALPAALGLIATVVGGASLLTEVVLLAARALALARLRTAAAPAARPPAAPVTARVVRFTCASCGAENEVADRFAGRKGKCRRCRTVIRAPATSG